MGEISSVTLGKCDRPRFSFGRKLCHGRSLHFCHFLYCSFAWKTRKPQKFVPLSSLCHSVRLALSRVRGLVPAFTLPLSPHSVVIMNERYKKTDEYESLTFVLFFWAICDFRCDLSRSNWFIFEIPLSKFWSLGRVHELALWSNKMAKEINSKQHRFRGSPEISRSFIKLYTFSHSKMKMTTVKWYNLRPRLNPSLLHFFPT